MQSAEQFRKNMFSESELLYSDGTLDTGRIDELLEAFANVRRQSPPSCLMCGNTGEVAIKHEPSGVWICIKCRDGQAELTELRAKLAATQEQLDDADAENGRIAAEAAALRERERWISVEEKLPPRHQNILCLNRDSRIFEGRICAGMHKPFFTYPYGDGSASNTCPDWIDVTHWKALSAAPQETERNGLTFKDAGEG